MTRIGQSASRLSRAGRWALGFSAAFWVAALFLSPAALFPVGALICHQRPERSFFVHGHQLAVCARCTGLYAGAAFAVPCALVAASALSARRARTLAVVAALPTIITWSLEFGGIAHFSNAIRFAAALPLGFVAGWLVLSVLAND